MKKIFLAAILVFLCQVYKAQAYVVDGNLSDWGVSLTAPGADKRHYLDTHTPTGPTVDYVTKDNAQAGDGFVYVGPGYSIGNTYDAEAMYFDTTTTNAYLAIVTGLPQTEITYPAGDIFIDTGKYQDPHSAFYDPKKYEYGIDISTSKLYKVDSWDDTVIFHSSDPWRIGPSRTYLAGVPFVYSGNQNSHYVLESEFPLNALNLKNGDAVYLHWTMKCGNDALNLKGSVDAVPEPASVALLACGLLFTMGLKRLRMKKIA